MTLTSLGYIGVRSPKLDDWDQFATRLLGMQKVDAATGVRAYRMDDRRQRFIVSDEVGETLGFIGWEADDAAALDALAGRLDNAGITVARGSRALTDQRHVRDLILFQDPAGNRLDAFYGAATATDPFVPGRPISSFVTGPLGMGHVVLQVEDIEPLLPFYRDILGLRVSDYGLSPIKLYFFHVNNRHHSFAMVETGRRGFHHLMMELGSLDDVGQGYDLAQVEKGRIAYTLGRHSNCYTTSFHAHTPSPFFIEYGWGSRTIDPGAWQPHETFDGPSFWGHERLHLDKEQRKRFRVMRMTAAAKGVRATSNPMNCAWLDAAIAKSR